MKFRTPVPLHIHIKGTTESKIYICWLNHNFKIHYKAHKWRKTFKFKITGWFLKSDSSLHFKCYQCHVKSLAKFCNIIIKFIFNTNQYRDSSRRQGGSAGKSSNRPRIQSYLRNQFISFYKIRVHKYSPTIKQ